MTIGGCADVPDAINPVAWYKNTVEVFTEDEKPTGTAQEGLAADRGKPAPGSDKPFPKLSAETQRPDTPSAEDTAPVAEGLVADRQQAKYSSEIIRRQGAPAQPLSDETAKAEAEAPAPPAMPRKEVTSAAAPLATAPDVSAPAAAAPAIAAPQLQAPQLQAPQTPMISVDAIYRARLAQQRPTTGQATLTAPANAQVPGQDSFDTAIVSSLGVEAGRAPAPAAPAPVMPGATAKASVQESGPSMRIATIQFGDGSARLDERDRRILQQVTRLYRERGGKIRIIGHASSRTRSMDPVRHKLVNFKVSLSRADAVASELERQGIKRDAIVTDARSDGAPVYYEVMATGEAGNRRAEVYFVN